MKEWEKEIMIWNGNELVFESNKHCGVTGISPNMPDEMGEEIAKRWNNFKSRKEVAEDCIKTLNGATYTDYEDMVNVLKKDYGIK